MLLTTFFFLPLLLIWLLLSIVDIPITPEFIFDVVVNLFIVVLFPLGIFHAAGGYNLVHPYLEQMVNMTGLDSKMVGLPSPDSSNNKDLNPYHYLALLPVCIMAVCFFLVFTYFPYLKKLDEGFRSQSSVCEDLYQRGKNKKYTVIPLLSKSMCKQILQEGIDYAKKHKWTTKRHDDYPTTDNNIDESWKNFDFIDQHVRSRVFGEIAKMYNVPKDKLGVNEYFIVKYEPTKQASLETHQDGSEFSFILALNDDYEGGGTYFPDIDKHISLKTGECLVFSGQNRHQGQPITKGKRFILTGFLHYEDENYCEDLLSIDPGEEQT